MLPKTRIPEGIVAVFLTFVLAARLGAQAAPPSDTVVPLDVSSKWILCTNEARDRLVLVSREDAESVLVAEGRSVGWYASLAPGGNAVCHKAFRGNEGALEQGAVVFDIPSRESTRVAGWAARCGTPAVSPNGLIAVTLGDDLLLLGPNGQERARRSLGAHVNLVAFSPDGGRLAWARDGVLEVWDFAQDTAERFESKEAASLWGPEFSPLDGSIAVRDASGKALVLNGGKPLEVVAEGEILGWTGVDDLLVLERVRGAMGVEQTNLVRAGSDKSLERVRLAEGDVSVAVGDGVMVTSQGSGGLRVLGGKAFEISVPSSLPAAQTAAPSTQNKNRRGVVTTASTVEIQGVPTVHQVYDTPNWFNGHWACNGTAAVMALAYDDLLEPHPITISVPYSHQNDYGFYVAEQYTVNGYTFSISSPDPNGTAAKGAYGYIVRNNWADTKGYMRDYFIKHGPTSAVDWSPNWSEVQQEIADDDPFVVLNSLTSAGHYITCIGYYKSQHTMLFNDPYGNKNTAGYPSYDGTRVAYDWPGYNNGYQNLNIVHCFIYCRYQGQSLEPWEGEFVTHTIPAQMEAGHVYRVSATYRNTGSSTWGTMTRLSTSNPRGSQSAFQAPSWHNFDRPASFAGQTVGTGSTATVSFDLVAPSSGGTFDQGFELVQDGASWFEGTDDDFIVPITVTATPGTILLEAENYDAYYDTSSGNFGNAYREDDVDIEPIDEGGYGVGWIDTNEWIGFDGVEATPGIYRLDLRVASKTTGGTCHLELGGTDATGPVSFGPTGEWTTYETIQGASVKLASTNQVQLVMDTTGFNVSWLRFVHQAAMGDVNCDGELSPADAQAAFECYVHGGVCAQGMEALAADMCADPDKAPHLTPGDAQAIFETYLGLEPSCP